jgi:pyridoxine/pyridoxamine 5'-phosphate oxidase
MHNKQDYYDFLNRHTLAVMSTVHTNGTPEAALIGFGQTENLELVFGTVNTSRKYTNLTANPHVALVIGWEQSETVQYEGTARELSPDELDIVRTSYWLKTPKSEIHNSNPAQRYFIVTPSWVRYTNLEAGTLKTSELQP